MVPKEEVSVNREVPGRPGQMRGGAGQAGVVSAAGGKEKCRRAGCPEPLSQPGMSPGVREAWRWAVSKQAVSPPWFVFVS